MWNWIQRPVVFRRLEGGWPLYVKIFCVITHISVRIFLSWAQILIKFFAVWHIGNEITCLETVRIMTHVFKFSRRQNSKFSRADSRVKRFIRSRVSETKSISVIRAIRAAYVPIPDTPLTQLTARQNKNNDSQCLLYRSSSASCWHICSAFWPTTASFLRPWPSSSSAT